MVATSTEKFSLFATRVQPLLAIVYSPEVVPVLTEQLFDLLRPYLRQDSQENWRKWSHNSVLMITYGDTLMAADGRSPLAVLAEFLETHLKNTLTGVHILPFFPYTSDDGFAIVDYLQVNPELGNWEEIKRIAGHFNLMFDLVINHVSSQHAWVKEFQANEKPGCDYLIEVDPTTEVSGVVRPRSTPLLTELDTTEGKKHVWTTFSPDQIDVNFANPDVLLEYVKIILFYIEAGARYLRLDAVGYLWKKLETTCIHLPETHAIVRLFREVLQMIDPGIAIITETNVPNRENLSYFGNRNEAHMIYNFSLPPLLLNALMQGRSDYLKQWMMSMPPAPIGCAYFNFTASHDGIGMRPAEGLLTKEEYDALIATMKKFGAEISMRSRADGTESPYEINISLFDAMKGTIAGKDEWQIQRFLCCQTIMMALEGIPAFYIHSLLATRNNHEGVKQTGHNRTINRYKWNIDELEAALADPESPHAIVFQELSRLIRIRRRQRAFHPNATQYTLHPLNHAIFAFWRQSMARDQSIFSIHNLSPQSQALSLADLNLLETDAWVDLISGDRIVALNDTYTMQPYQSLWITNKVDSAEDVSMPDPLIDA
ncbi:MAG: alpha-amylase family glycosyl hydrolase [Cyanobacteria bacterium P01_H01_bin.58]